MGIDKVEILESVQGKNKANENNFPWDVPTKDVSEIASKFIYGKFEMGDVKMPYRLLVPKEKKKLPIVVYLHGAGDNGDDNEKQLEHNVGIEFARNEWIKNNPCYILAPQCLKGHAWEMSMIQSVLKSLINQVVQNYLMIDRNRIYLYGCSMGSIGGFRFIKDNPNYLAGALLICGATSRAELIKLVKTPMWLFHAKDDNTVSTDIMQHPIYKTEIIGSAVIYRELLKLGKTNIHYTEYPANMIHKKYGVKAHCAWIPAFENDEAKKWLFSNKLL